MFCQNCSAENAEDDRFCCQCGSPLRTSEPVDVQSLHASEERGSQRKQERGSEKRYTGRMIAFILAIVLGIMAAACGIFWFVGQKIPQTETKIQNEDDQTAERETGSRESFNGISGNVQSA